jgi:hypothetical protein
MEKHQLLKTINKLNKQTIYFGPQGFALATTENELKKAQQGFSTYPDGSNLPSSEAGNWQSTWLVIATDTELGDPYFVDINNEKLPVYTAMLTNNVWQAEPVATSLNKFINCLKLLANNGQQSEPQFIPDENTITAQKKLTTLKEQLIKYSDCENFWLLFFECYLDWLTDIDE